MIEWSWVIPKELIPKYNYATWWEESEEAREIRSRIWHYGM